MKLTKPRVLKVAFWILTIVVCCAPAFGIEPLGGGNNIVIPN